MFSVVPFRLLRHRMKIRYIVEFQGLSIRLDGLSTATVEYKKLHACLKITFEILKDAQKTVFAW